MLRITNRRPTPTPEEAAARRASERLAWRSFTLSLISLAIAFLLAVYSDVLSREGRVTATFLAGSTSLALSLFVGIKWVPVLARRTRMEWLRTTVDYHLTRGGVLYIAVVFVVSIAALNTGNNMLFLILAAMLAAILVSGAVSRVVLGGLEVEIVLPDHVFARQPVLARVTLRNAKIALPSLSVMVGGPTELDRRIRRKAAKKRAPRPPPAGRWLQTGVYFPYLKASGESSQTIEVIFAKRGVYRQENIAISSRFPFGLLEKVRKIPAAREMVVFPSVEPTEEFYEILPLLSGEIESYYRGRGHDLYSIRDYQISDSARFVDWKASAHTAQLKVREFTREDERRVQLVFDRRAPDNLEQTRRRFEAAVDLCAALAWHFEQIDSQVQFVAEGFQTAMAPAGEILYDILGYLARVEPGGPGFDWAALAGGDEPVFKIILTPASHGSIPTSLWASSYFVFHEEL